MAPWGSKASSKPTPQQLGESPARARGPSRMTPDEVLDHAYGIPTLAPPTDLRRPNDSSVRNGHSRSQSQPFPSIFSSGGKKNADGGRPGLESTDNSLGSSSRSPGKSNISKHTKVPEKDLRTGHCMTCNSGVKWPKDINVFRCMVCQTINDLKPVVLGVSSRPKDSVTGAVPISLQRTRNIIDNCTRSYLEYRIRRLRISNVAEQLSSLQITDSTDSQLSSQMVNFQRDEDASTHDSPAENNTPPMNIPIAASVRGNIGYDAAYLAPDHSSRLYSRSNPEAFESNSFIESRVSPKPTFPNNSGFKYRPSPKDLAHQSESQGDTASNNAHAKKLFKSLEEYIVTSFQRESVNSSFIATRPGTIRTNSDDLRKASRNYERDNLADAMPFAGFQHFQTGNDAQTGLWNGHETPLKQQDQHRLYRNNGSKEASSRSSQRVISARTPRIDWKELNEWYRLVIAAGDDWESSLQKLPVSDHQLLENNPFSAADIADIRAIVFEAQEHIQRTLLKATENMLKRPGSPLHEPDSIRFLLILLSNPLLYPSSKHYTVPSARSGHGREPQSNSEEKVHARHRLDSRSAQGSSIQDSDERPVSSPLPATSTAGPGKHSGIIKRILGLLANLNNECHHALVMWFSRYSETRFREVVELVGSFVTYRLTRQHGRHQRVDQDPTGGLIPTMSASDQGSSAALHAALGGTAGRSKQPESKTKSVVYQDDWQIRAAATVMQLLHKANGSGTVRSSNSSVSVSNDLSGHVSPAARKRAHLHGQILATSDFYNTLLDYSDIVADFEAWENKRAKFAFCKYPFFISIGAKIKLLEYDARRQQEDKARQAFFDSIMTRKTLHQYLVLRVRRDCLVEDSLKGVGEVIGSGDEEIKKGLRIEFKGEEGVDAGGLRKEWFLLLVREVFNPEHGMFVYDEDSHFCYFNPHSFETSDQFFLVGVVLGLAIYNSTILDIAFPPFTFRKLLAASPAPAQGTAPRPFKLTMTYTLEDLAEYRPALARGLQQLLEYDGDVQATFLRDFVADVDRYGTIVQVPLCANGDKRPVTNANRREFVDLYVKYLLDNAVARQFEPFKRGFWQVCGGNALSLFQPEEIELLVRGSDEALDIQSLQAVAVYEGWGTKDPGQNDPTIRWFWQSFSNAEPKEQRKLLGFITGSDRIPATGAANLVIRVQCLGTDQNRYPVARTCFNALQLWRYDSYERVQIMIWRAVYESEGFGLK